MHSVVGTVSHSFCPLNSFSFWHTLALSAQAAAQAELQKRLAAAEEKAARTSAELAEQLNR